MNRNSDRQTNRVRVGVGSKNPAKVEAVRDAFEKMGYTAEVVGMDVPSGVSDQPFSDEETVEGAVNRAKAVMQMNLDPALPLDYAVGLEGGVVETAFGVFVCNWGAVCDRNGVVGIGGGHRVQLPPVITIDLHKGVELGTAIDNLTGGMDIKKKEGTIGVLTNNQITRRLMFRDVVLCAFAKFYHPEWYKDR